MKAIEKIRKISEIFKNNKIDNPEQQATEIVLNALNIDKIKLFTDNPHLTFEQIHFIDSLVNRRLKREPLEYIIGKCDFYNIRLKIGPGVLIPRPETEIIVEEFEKRARLIKTKGKRLLDLCTGSGCIAISIAKLFPNLKVFGVDISWQAICYANENKVLNDVKNVYFLVGDLFSPFKIKAFSYITANPPYLKTDEIPLLQPEIRDYEPVQALDGGYDGLTFYRRILKEAKNYLVNKGLIFFEIGIKQASEIKHLAVREGFEIIDVIKDLAGIERVMILMLNDEL